MATADEIRRLREETSIFSRLFDLARQQGESLEQEGRRPVLGGLLSKEPVMGTDTIRYEGITPLLLNLIEPIARGIDAPRAAAQNLIPQEDMISEAFGTAGTAMIGGGLAAKPSGSLGANTIKTDELRRQANIQRFGYDPNEVQKVDTSYRGSHQPTGPLDDYPVRLDDLTMSTKGEQAGYPNDFYSSQGQRIYAQGPRFEGDEFGIANQQSYEAIQAARGNPNAEVTIYRGVPDKDDITTINPGDFVTLSPKYAELHAYSGYGPSGEDAGKVISQRVKVKDVYFAGDDVNEFGYFPTDVAANASKSTGLLSVASDVAERGDQILNMLKSGRADDITDSMFDMRDPVKNTQLNQYLFENYDLPMDEASRMARAREMGFDVDNVFYHGTDADFLSASADMGAVDRYKTGFYSSDNPNIAETYAPRDGGKIIPVLTRNDPDMIIDAKGSNWNQLEFDLPTYSSQMGDEDLYSYFFNMFADNDMEPLNTNAIARQRRFEGDSSVMFENLVDRGGVYPYGDTSLANFPSNIRTDFYPSSLRSKFARFDPRLRNNENLLAANASPISGILAQSGVSENQAQRIEDYLRKRGLLD